MVLYYLYLEMLIILRLIFFKNYFSCHEDMPSYVCLWGLTWVAFLGSFFHFWVCVVAFLLSGGQNLQQRLANAAAFILCKSQSLLSLQSGAAAEEKGKQMSDIPSASLFSDLSSCMSGDSASKPRYFWA